MLVHYKLKFGTRDSQLLLVSSFLSFTFVFTFPNSLPSGKRTLRSPVYLGFAVILRLLMRACFKTDPLRRGSPAATDPLCF